jgi:hypothetical protein
MRFISYGQWDDGTREKLLCFIQKDDLYRFAHWKDHDSSLMGEKLSGRYKNQIKFYIDLYF